MRRLFLGVDHRFSCVAFVFASAVVGLALKYHAMPMQQVYHVGLAALIFLGATALFYLAFSLNYQWITHLLLFSPGDNGLRYRLASLMRMRRTAAVGFGVMAATVNALVMLLVYDAELFSWASLALTLAFGIYLSLRWFSR